MAKNGKNITAVREKIDTDKVYELAEAVSFLKESSFVKFDETAEIAFRLGVNPTQSDQNVRGTVSLPHGSGKDVRVVVFATGPAADAAREAGAAEVGFEDLLQKVKGGWTDMDVIVATPEAMKEVRKLGKVLGPRGLMPNPKTGTVTMDVGKAVQETKAGKIDFKVDKFGIIHSQIGKVSFDKNQIIENITELVQNIIKLKPSSAKGTYIRSIYVSSTMSPSVQIELKSISQV